jgi:threonine/homoserine/homoserine lactone efflux protein
MFALTEITFVPALSVLVAFSLAAAFLTLTPGPDMTLFLGKAVSGGRAAGFAAFAGAATGLFCHSVFAAIGLSALLAASETAFTVLKIAGVGYLLYLAYEALRKGTAFSLEAGRGGGERLKRIFLKGLTVNLLNPKIVVFFVTFLPQFVHAGDPHASGKLFFLGLWFIAVAVPLTIPMILGAASIARFLHSTPKALRIVDYGFAGVMAAFALRLVTVQATN